MEIQNAPEPVTTTDVQTLQKPSLVLRIMFLVVSVVFGYAATALINGTILQSYTVRSFFDLSGLLFIPLIQIVSWVLLTGLAYRFFIRFAPVKNNTPRGSKRDLKIVIGLAIIAIPLGLFFWHTNFSSSMYPAHILTEATHTTGGRLTFTIAANDSLRSYYNSGDKPVSLVLHQPDGSMLESRVYIVPTTTNCDPGVFLTVCVPTPESFTFLEGDSREHIGRTHSYYTLTQVGRYTLSSTNSKVSGTSFDVIAPKTVSGPEMQELIENLRQDSQNQ